MLKNIVQIGFSLVLIYTIIYPLINQPNQQLVSKTSDAGSLKQPQVTSDEAQTLQETVEIKPHPLPDFAAIYDVKEKKRAFFSYLSPYVEQINKEILRHREFVLRMEKRPQFQKDIEHLNKIAKKYHVDTEQDFSQIRALLLLRVDILPIELVLMQAANESAWGTSRFALVANNLFGQWCFSKGCGVVPSGRPEGKTYEVRKFNHPIDSIKSYYNNLNTGYAYEDLRNIRKQLRDQQQSIDAIELAHGLLAYSTRREEYVSEIQKMISINKKYITNG